MTLFNKVKEFVKTVVDNPVKSGIIAFLIMRMLKQHGARTEHLKVLCDGIQIVKKNRFYEVLYDSNSDVYSVIKRGGKVEFFNTLYEAEAVLKHKKLFEKIEKRGNKWVVLDSSGRKVLGEHDTKEDALKQLRAIEISKKQSLSLDKRLESLKNKYKAEKHFFKEVRDDATPGFSMTKCIQRLGEEEGVDNPEALCQFIYQKVKRGEVENPFPE